MVEVDSNRAADKAGTGEWKKFRDHGILCTSLLDDFQKHYRDRVFTKNDFLLLLERLLIVSQFSTTEYFFPAVLDVKEDVKLPNS